MHEIVNSWQKFNGTLMAKIKLMAKIHWNTLQYSKQHTYLYPWQNNNVPSNTRTKF